MATSEAMVIRAKERASKGGRPDLIGWQAIADYLGVSRSTALRFESRGAPVFLWGQRAAAWKDMLGIWYLTELKSGKAA